MCFEEEYVSLIDEIRKGCYVVRFVQGIERDLI